MVNHANRSHAVSLFSRYLKGHGPAKFRGMSLARIRRIVAANISSVGHCSDPYYTLPGIAERYVDGAICLWTGKWFRTVAA
jgi:hypothetical protein